MFENINQIKNPFSKKLTFVSTFLFAKYMKAHPHHKNNIK